MTFDGDGTASGLPITTKLFSPTTRSIPDAGGPGAAGWPGAAGRPGASPVPVEAVGIVREFKSGTTMIQALKGIDLRILPGEFVALRGRSGSGKTTLMHILVGLDTPTRGQVTILGQALATMREAERAKLRREQVGMLFQNAHLFPSLTALENVELPLRLARVAGRDRTARASAALAMVGLSARAHHRGLELSGGEQQHVALARALVHQPRFVVADEPTGNLDTTTGQEITALLVNIAHSQQIGLLVATHDANIVAAADRVLSISDGQITDVTIRQR